MKDEVGLGKPVTDASFKEGMSRLVKAFGAAPLDPERTRLYHEALLDIPDRLFVAGIQKLIREWTPRSNRPFPIPAEIGEACIPGHGLVREEDPYTKRLFWKESPWPQRLAELRRPKKETRESTKAAEPPPSEAYARQALTGIKEIVNLVVNKDPQAREKIATLLDQMTVTSEGEHGNRRNAA